MRIISRGRGSKSLVWGVNVYRRVLLGTTLKWRQGGATQFCANFPCTCTLPSCYKGMVKGMGPRTCNSGAGIVSGCFLHFNFSVFPLRLNISLYPKFQPTKVQLKTLQLYNDSKAMCI